MDSLVLLTVVSIIVTAGLTMTCMTLLKCKSGWVRHRTRSIKWVFLLVIASVLSKGMTSLGLSLVVSDGLAGDGANTLFMFLLALGLYNLIKRRVKTTQTGP